MNLASSRLAAKTGTRQLDALHACNRLADHVDAQITALWRKLVKLLAREGKRRQQSAQMIVPHALAHEIAAIMHEMQRVAHTTLRDNFERLAQWGHASAADALAQTLPLAYMRSAANDRVSVPGQGARPPLRGLLPQVRGMDQSRLPPPLAQGGAQPSSSHFRLGHRERNPSTPSQASESRGLRIEKDADQAKLAPGQHAHIDLTHGDDEPARGPGKPFPSILQTSDFDCGAACFRAVAIHFDTGPEGEAEFLRLLNVDPAVGARTQDMLRVGRALMHVRELKGRRSLIAFVQAGWPVIVPIQSEINPHGDYEGSDHYVTVIGVSKRAVRIQDPAKGRRTLSWGLFLRLWKDWETPDESGQSFRQYGIAFMRQLKGRLRKTDILEDDPQRTSPGAIMLRLGLGGELQVTDRLGRLREPARPELPDEEQRVLFQQLLFPPLPFERILAILRHPVAGSSWEQDLTRSTSLAHPSLIAGIVGGGFAAGNTPAEVARLLMPAVKEVKSTARRIARTHGMQIVHRAAKDAHDNLGDMVVGFQVFAQLDQHTRSWHAARSGEIFYKNPTGDQKGPRQQPHPPMEAEDPAERPPHTPRLAPN